MKLLNVMKRNREVTKVMQTPEAIEAAKKAKLEDAKKMLEEEITLEQVMRITGLTKEEIMEDMKKM